MPREASARDRAGIPAKVRFFCIVASFWGPRPVSRIRDCCRQSDVRNRTFAKAADPGPNVPMHLNLRFAKGEGSWYIGESARLKPDKRRLRKLICP